MKRTFLRYLSAAALWYFSCEAYRRNWILPAMLLKTINYFVYQSILCYQCDIKRDIQLEHNGWGCAIHPNVSLGQGVRLSHHVTFAGETAVGSKSRIVVEDNVVVGAYAMIIGNDRGGLKIGRGAIIGAGTIVNRDVVPGCAIIAMPSRPTKSVKTYNDAALEHSLDG